MSESTNMLKQSKKVLSRKKAIPKVSDSDLQFEKDWQYAISGDEFVKRAHQHIDKLYSKE